MLVLLTIAVPPRALAADVEIRPELRTGGLVWGTDNTQTSLNQFLFHRDTLAAADNEALAVSLPSPVSGSGAGSGAGSGVAIAQASAETIAGTSTGYFDADTPFYPCINHGAPLVGFGHLWDPYPVTTAYFTSDALFFPEMVNAGNLLNDSQLEELNATRMTLPPPEAAGAMGALLGLYGMEGADGSGLEARDEGLPVILSTLTFDYDAVPGQINNTSIVERLWRNSHLGHLLDQAYEGDAAYPTWLMPVEPIWKLMEMKCPTNVIQYSLEQTRPGTALTRTFWTL